jgi:NADP-dependent 3-hydroxy acid dehydrogenase YdfG
MMRTLTGAMMIILITGATAGFGESMTRRFIANGHKVIATGRREERLKTLQDELGAISTRAAGCTQPCRD